MLDLKKLAKELDEALEKETPESLKKWLKKSEKPDEQLEDCPFCGGEAFLDLYPRYDKTTDKYVYTAEIRCINQITCNASINLASYEKDYSVEKVRKMWNRRT